MSMPRSRWALQYALHYQEKESVQDHSSFLDPDLAGSEVRVQVKSCTHTWALARISFSMNITSEIL